MAGDTVSTLGTRTNVLSPSLSLQSPFSFAILNVGAPAAGMNAAVRSAVRIGICQGHTVYVVSDGFEGLSKGQVRGTVSLGAMGFPGGWVWAWRGVVGCFPTPKSSAAACRSVRWAGTTWQAGWDAAGPCWAPSGKHSTRGARGCSRGDAAVPWDCGDPTHPVVSSPLCHRRTLPKTCMEKIVENVRKFNIQGLLVIGGFEVRGNPQPCFTGGRGRLSASQAVQAPQAIPFGMWIQPRGQHLPSPRLLAGIRGGAAAGGGPRAVRGALHHHVRHPRHHQQQRAWDRLQSGLRHGRQRSHGGEGQGWEGQLTGSYCSTSSHRVLG